MVDVGIDAIESRPLKKWQCSLFVVVQRFHFSRILARFFIRWRCFFWFTSSVFWLAGIWAEDFVISMPFGCSRSV